MPFYLSSVLGVLVIFGKVLSIKSHLTSNVIVVKVVLPFTFIPVKFPQLSGFVQMSIPKSELRATGI